MLMVKQFLPRDLQEILDFHTAILYFQQSEKIISKYDKTLRSCLMGWDD